MEDSLHIAHGHGFAPITDWDDAYENTAHIPDGPSHLPRWQHLSQQVLETARIEGGIFMPTGTPCGLMVFVHGGYWMATDPGYYAHLSRGAVGRGWAALIPPYPLAPAGGFTQMIAALSAAITSAATRIPGPVVLCGHSAGGHLAARLICRDTSLAPQILARIKRIVPISGIFDLRPLMRTRMAEPLRLNRETAAAHSPALLEPVAGIDVHAWVGGDERPEFIRQTWLLSLIWHGLGVPVRVTQEAGRHHFDVIDGLSHSGSDLTAALLDNIAARP